jgi:hypothetical protein
MLVVIKLLYNEGRLRTKTVRKEEKFIAQFKLQVNKILIS